MCLSIPEFVSVIKDVVLAVAALSTTIVAAKGLTTWNRQLRGTANFDAARALAKAAYKVREKLQMSRSPFLSGNEFPPEFHAAGLTRTPKQEADGYAFVYANRWMPIGEAMQEFDASVLEAEALWGNAVRNTTDKFRQIVHEVNVAVDTFIANAAVGNDLFEGNEEFRMKIAQKVAASPTDSENEINIRLSSAIREIDKLLLPHLQRN